MTGVAIDEALEFEGALAELSALRARNRRLGEELSASLRELRESRARIMSVAVQERRRIERDLHDGAQQRLVAARVTVGLARGLLRQDPLRSEQILEALGRDLEEALDELRALAHGVYPSILSEQGIGPALRSATAGGPLRVSVDSDGAARYSPEIESAVYFCCLECVQNAAKHAIGATRARIRLRAGSELTFEVIDDGAGIAGPRATGSGLTNMVDRLAAVDGRMEMRSAPGHGTAVTGRIPLQTAP